MAHAQKQVRIIEPLERFVNRINLVGCYARVSSDSEDQLNSYNNQVDFYESYVNSLENSKLVKIYTDEGITGTRMDKRDGFLQMIEDCRKGLINTIITKSISRFARNITETLSVVRELKSIGVSVYFMTEKIDTAKMGSEMMLTVYAACAEIESKAISNAQKWAFRTRAKEGRYNQPKLPYGYQRIDGEVKVIEEEAKIVEDIFNKYVNKDFSVTKLVDYLNKHYFKKKKWSQSTVSSMLKNERYCGDMLLQKKYSPDVFPYKLVTNKGELAQYYVYDVFPKIIDRELFEKANEKLVNNKLKFNKKQTDGNREYLLTSKIKCEHCGGTFKRRVLRNKEYWSCSNHVTSAKKCEVKMIGTDEIEDAFLKIFYKLKENIHVLEAYKKHIVNFTTNDDDRCELDLVNRELKKVTSSINTLVRYYQKDLISLEDYKKKHNELLVDKSVFEMQKCKLNEKIYQRFEVIQTQIIIECLESMKEITALDEEIFNTLVDSIEVGTLDIQFTLKNDLKLKVERKQF